MTDQQSSPLSWPATFALAATSGLEGIWATLAGLPWAMILGFIGTIVLPAYKLATDRRLAHANAKITELVAELVVTRAVIASATEPPATIKPEPAPIPADPAIVAEMAAMLKPEVEPLEPRS